MVRDKTKELRRRVYQVLEQGPVGDPLSVVVDRALVALILVNLVLVALQSVPAFAAGYALWFDAIEIFFPYQGK